MAKRYRKTSEFGKDRFGMYPASSDLLLANPGIRLVYDGLCERWGKECGDRYLNLMLKAPSYRSLSSQHLNRKKHSKYKGEADGC